MDFWGHLKTVNHHRALVRKYCFRLGLYWQGLTHDLSKYSPVEFLAGVKYFQGDHSPNDAQRKARGYSASWMHHKGRNRHHFEFWTDYGPEGIQGVEMSAVAYDLRPAGRQQGLPGNGFRPRRPLPLLSPGPEQAPPSPPRHLRPAGDDSGKAAGRGRGRRL